MIDIGFIREQLGRRQRERQVKFVAIGSGVALRTIWHVLKGQNPNLANAEKLQAFLKATMRRKHIHDVQPPTNGAK
jgi:Ser-tRNA(Ala) deacylase AlaX